MNSLVITPQRPPINVPWFEEDQTETRHEYFIPRSFALYLLRIIRRYPTVESMTLLGLHPLHHGLQVCYTDGSSRVFHTVDEILERCSECCWRPPACA